MYDKSMNSLLWPRSVAVSCVKAIKKKKKKDFQERCFKSQMTKVLPLRNTQVEVALCIGKSTL